LKLQNQHLEETVAARTRELTEAHSRLTKLDQAKDDFLKIISHEFRTPLNGLFGVSEILFDELPPFAEQNELRHLFERSRYRILSLLDDALLLTQFNVEAMRIKSGPVSLNSAMNRAIEAASEFAQSRHVTIYPLRTDLGLIRADEDLLVGALRAMLETAVKFSTQGTSILVAQGVGADSPNLTIESRGRIIPISVIGKFFDIFSISEAITPGGDLGLAPAVACRILSLFGVTVTVANLNPPGIRLTIAF
jgi:K+-sensing histidine kinase KdpD